MSDKLKVPNSFRDRVAAAKAEAEAKAAQQATLPEGPQKLLEAAKATFNESHKVALAMPERIALLLDCSGSMNSYAGDKRKIEYLKLACENFLNRINFFNTSVMLKTFPKYRDNNEDNFVSLSDEELEDSIAAKQNTTVKYVGCPLLCNHFLISLVVNKLRPTGSTPLGECLTETCTNEVQKDMLTRAIIISDGEQTDAVFAEQSSFSTGVFAQHSYQLFINNGIPIDCVHIGDSSSGEATLQRIAKDTDGVYMKFTDVNKFSQALHYLTPGMRGYLTSGNVNANDIGAKEIK